MKLLIIVKVPCLSNLCSDPFWGVRKSCAEVIHPLAQVCSKESRWNVLSPCLIQLLQDQSRWVKTAALRVLGYFISTFQRTNDEQDDQPVKDSQINQFSEQIPINENDRFNDFHFWREPIFNDFNFDDEISKDSKQSLFNLFLFQLNIFFFEIR